jgi:hypothetical protein
MVLSVAWATTGANSRAADCTVTSVGRTPIQDLGTGLYLGLFQGGLYPNGQNAPPTDHEAEGLARAAAIAPLDPDGNPDPKGKFVMMSIGMSNTTQEYCSASSFEPCDAWTFMGQAADSTLVNHTTLAIVNGALGGQVAAAWDSPTDANYDRVRDDVLIPRGLSEAQVQIVWVKEADAGPMVSLPNANADAYMLETHLGNIVRAVRVRYPNVQMVFLSSRVYAGYASTTLNPEPYAYESGFSVKWLIEAQIVQMAGGAVDPRAGDLDYHGVAPWLAWGPNLWADGLVPRSDGLIWECADFSSDGTHPSISGREKVGTLLLDFMLNSAFTVPWFLAAPQPGDCDGNTLIELVDYSEIAPCLAGPEASSASPCACGDFDEDDDVDMRDFLQFTMSMTPPAPDLDPAVDDFERTNLGDTWAVAFGTPAIINASDFGATASGASHAGWQGSAFSADQFCEGEMAAGWNPANSIQLCVRSTLQTGARYGFRWLGGAGGNIELRYHNGPTSVLLASAGGHTLSAGDVMRIEAVGSVIRGYINGGLVLTGNDGNLAGGTASVVVFFGSGTSVSFLESWSGGSIDGLP